MANKPLKSIKFPNLSNTYTVPEVDATLTGTGKAADAKKTGDEITAIKADLSELDATVNGSGGGQQDVTSTGIERKSLYKNPQYVAKKPISSKKYLANKIDFNFPFDKLLLKMHK